MNTSLSSDFPTEGEEGSKNSRNEVVIAGNEGFADSDGVEVLAKLAYEAYMADAYRDGSTFHWERLNVGQRQHWRASAQAVKKHVLQSGEA